MVCFYTVYLLIMYFNPRIEAWLYKVTNTTSPEFKSELHATNGKKNGYSQVAEVDAEDSETKQQDDNKTDQNDEEKGDVEKGKEDHEQNQKEEGKDRKAGFRGKLFLCFSGRDYMYVSKLEVLVHLCTIS